MSCEIDGITRRLLASYEAIGGINHLDGTNLPSRDALPAICRGLLGLLFPGFFTEEPMTTACVAGKTRRQLDDLVARLTLETTRSLRSQKDVSDHADGVARRLVCDFLHYLPEVRALLLTDVEAAYEGDPAARSYEEIILSYPCIEAIAIQRLAHWLYQRGVPLLPRMMTEWAHSRTGIDLHPGAVIGSHFFIDHGTGVVVGETCVIGRHVKLYHGVTLGAKSFAKDEQGQIIKGMKRHPEVGDHVTIYPNATILGGTTVIGEHATIGANVHLAESVAPYAVIALGDQTHRVRDKRAVQGRPAKPPVPA
jgi:serine O-acetyltransferase